MDTVSPILTDLRRGKLIILTDDRARENEADLVCAAEKITPAKIIFMARYGRGLICVPLTGRRAHELKLSPMVLKNTAKFQCNFTVSVDAKECTTGISAYDRVRTIQRLLSPKTKPHDLHRPGHIFPLIGSEGGVIIRPGHTEGVLDLLRIAHLKPMGVLCEIMGDDGRMLSGRRLGIFAKKHKLKVISIQSLITYIKKLAQNGIRVERAVETRLPTSYGEFRAIAYRTNSDEKEYIALVRGRLQKKPALIRIHSECLTGDVFHSLRCDCNAQLDRALKHIARERNGILIYLRHEGRGIGLINKLKAYNLQDIGYDTISANEKLGFTPDDREYDVAAHILKDLGVSEVHLMTNNPEKIRTLEKFGIRVLERIPIEITPRSRKALKYMRAKKVKMGHLLSKV